MPACQTYTAKSKSKPISERGNLIVSASRAKALSSSIAIYLLLAFMVSTEKAAGNRLRCRLYTRQYDYDVFIPQWSYCMYTYSALKLYGG